MSSASAFSELAAALEGRIKIISDREWYAQNPTTHLTALQDVSEKIEALVAKLPSPVDPNLGHYLQRKSYDKALAWIRENA